MADLDQATERSTWTVETSAHVLPDVHLQCFSVQIDADERRDMDSLVRSLGNPLGLLHPSELGVEIGELLQSQFTALSPASGTVITSGEAVTVGVGVTDLADVLVKASQRTLFSPTARPLVDLVPVIANYPLPEFGSPPHAWHSLTDRLGQYAATPYQCELLPIGIGQGPSG